MFAASGDVDGEGGAERWTRSGRGPDSQLSSGASACACAYQARHLLHIINDQRDPYDHTDYSIAQSCRYFYRGLVRDS